MRANQLVAVLAPLLEMRGGLLLRGLDVLVVDDIVIAPHLRLALWQRRRPAAFGPLLGLLQRLLKLFARAGALEHLLGDDAILGHVRRVRFHAAHGQLDIVERAKESDTNLWLRLLESTDRADLARPPREAASVAPHELAAGEGWWWRGWRRLFDWRDGLLGWW